MGSPLPASFEDEGEQARRRGAQTVAQAALLVMLFAVPALAGLHTAAVGDLDLWWHLRSGEWIMQHHAFPRTDVFSIFGAGRPWAAYSWLFEVIVFQLFHHLGLLGVMAYVAAVLLAITVACHHLVRRLQRDVSASILLTFAATFSCGHLYTPRPWLLSILFFVLALDVLMHARRTGKRRELAWLPVIFLLWANVHIQFLDGLLLLALGWVESLVARWHRGVSTRLDLWSATLVALTSLGATLCNPYGWHLYRVAFDLTTQAGVMNKIQELQALPFRDATDWCVLALAMGAVAVLARSGRLLFFETALLAIAVFLAFRSQRDVWIVAIASVAILASRGQLGEEPAPVPPVWLTPFAAVMATVILAGYVSLQRYNNDHLATKLAETAPIRALAFVNARGYRGPVFNDFGWGGYLIWSLRQPVSIDGRAAFYGDQRIDRSIATWNGKPDWHADPELKAARLIIGSVQTPLVQLLRA